jgi:hypothetical protein
MSVTLPGHADMNTYQSQPIAHNSQALADIRVACVLAVTNSKPDLSSPT